MHYRHFVKRILSYGHACMAKEVLHLPIRVLRRLRSRQNAKTGRRVLPRRPVKIGLAARVRLLRCRRPVEPFDPVAAAGAVPQIYGAEDDY